MKVAVVTGSSYGLGKSISEMLLKDDYKVYGVSRTEPKIQDTNFIWIKADLLNDESFKLIYSSISEDKIDLLINNAGTHIFELTEEVTRKNFSATINLNFIAPVFLVKALFSKLSNGLIINISSTSDRFAEKGGASYSASKAALQMYFDVLAIENENIKVVHLLPDFIDTPLQHKISDKTGFDWNLCTTSEENAEFIKDVINGKYQIESGSRTFVLNNETADDASDPEKLYYYNVDTKEFKKLK